MTLWYNSADNTLHDDANGEALLLPSWPKGMTQATQPQIDAIRNPPLTAAAALVAYQQSARDIIVATDATFARIARAIRRGKLLGTDATVALWDTWLDNVRLEISALAVPVDAAGKTITILQKYPLPADSSGNITYPANT
jgi:hypothetical protein